MEKSSLSFNFFRCMISLLLALSLDAQVVLGLAMVQASSRLQGGSEQTWGMVGVRSCRGRRGLLRRECRDWGCTVGKDSPLLGMGMLQNLALLSLEGFWQAPMTVTLQCKQRPPWVSTKSSCRKAVTWCCAYSPSFDAVSAVYI